MRYTFTSHKRYNDGGAHEPFDMFKGTAAAGLDDCHKETEAFAKEQEHLITENTRSNPADRVKRIREGLAWSRLADTQAAIRSSSIYKKSAVLFLHCVLSSVYGEPVTLEIHTFDGLNKEAKYPGRGYFLKEMQNALYGEEQERHGMEIDRQKIIYLYRGRKMIGLMSANGPIPAINYEPPFPFNTLPIDDTEGTATITEALEDQDKQIVQYWLSKNPELVKACDLFHDISNDLQNMGVDAKIERTLTIVPTEAGFPNFPYLKNYDGELLADSITIVPLSDKNSPLGYNMPTQMIEVNNTFYGFIPPLSQQAVKWTRNDAFQIRSFTVPEKGMTIEDNKLGAVHVDCKITVDGLDITVSKVYEPEQLRYVKQFPVFSVYGPAPKFGWIAQRNEKPAIPYVSPLINDTVSGIDGLNDIELEDIRFEPIEDNYLLYCGVIPQWAGIRGNGNWLGALPLRVDVGDKMQTNWKEAPAFVHKTLPPSKKIKVAVDIGSSRSVVVFLKDLEDDNSTEYTLIENDQSLRIDLTSMLGTGDNSDDFTNALFQPEKEYRKITGKTPLVVFKTAKFSTDSSGTDPVLLYRLGKLAFLDPQQFASAGSKDYDSNIKAQIKTGMPENTKKQAMRILVQGLLTVIIERAIHLGCCDIDIRTAYLAEQHNVMEQIWQNAITAIVSRMPEDIKKLINISVDLCLPESLAIANSMSHAANRFEAESGAAFVDIGDFSTDIALFQNTDKSRTEIQLINNFSIHFAGARILLRPIWDYLCMSQTVEFKNIFTLPEKKDESINTVVKELSDERQKQMSSNSINVGQDKVKSGLLCLMNKLKSLNSKVANDSEKLENLYNLFDLGYLAEMLILKRLIKDVPVSGGRFNIHLFGGGSSYFKEQKDRYNWSDVLGRACETYNKSEDGNILALGLLRGKGVGEDKEKGDVEVHSNILEAAETEKENARNYAQSKRQPKIPDNDEELKQGYIQFVMEIRNLKGDGWRIWKNSANVAASPKDEAPDKNLLRIFNVRKTQEDGLYALDNASVWEKRLNNAKLSAKNCIKDCPTEDTEIFKILFAYEMAYSCIMDVYSGERNLKEEEKNR